MPNWILWRIYGKHFAQDFTNGSFEKEGICSSKASSNLQGSIRILRAFIIKMMIRYQNFKKESFEVAISNIQKIIQRKENDKIYGADNYCLSPEYRKFQVASHAWHS